ncbi:MAG: metallophosphoesterase [Fimbriimonadia bacterium]|nr:metallophosphoesterase [Fimbriimonadia bacterium]
MHVSLLHTNDTHGKWDNALAQELKSLRETHGALLLDSGDAVKCGNIAIPVRPEPAWKHMQAAGYAAMTLGNREFHFNPAAFRAKVGESSFPLLCANLRAKSAKTYFPAVPSVILSHSGCRVGVFGLTVPMITPRMKSAIISAYLFDSPLESAREVIDTLRPQVDLLIALTHIGARKDRELAERYPAIDLILGGHSHTPICPPEWVNGVPILQSLPFGRGASLIQLERLSERWGVEASLIEWQRNR